LPAWTPKLGGMRVELHFHLLPGVDDGPRDAAEAVALARAAVADGTRTVVATPHAGFVDPATLRDRVASLRVPLDVRPGAELLATDVMRLSARELDLVAQGPPGRRWVLSATAARPFSAPMPMARTGRRASAPRSICSAATPSRSCVTVRPRCCVTGSRACAAGAIAAA
jgi:hypothetical protein